jgi:hypothetical protein
MRISSNTSSRPLRLAPVPLETLEILQSKLRAEESRQQKFGHVRPAISTNWHGSKFVAVANNLYYAPQQSWRTFPDFLKHYISTQLTPDWGNAEIAKPFQQRHDIMKWYDRMCRFQRRQPKQPDGLCGCLPNGAMKAYLLLAYDLYVLRHHSALQETVVKRLKRADQFQGARHELFVAATCIRAGFDIKYEDETDKTQRHPEFAATYKKTGQQFSVEAKSRHHPGVLGHPGERKSADDVKLRIGRLMNEALAKKVSNPYVIFLDLNLPPLDPPLCDETWLRRLWLALDRAKPRGSDKDRFELIVFSNQPYHYLEGDEPAPSGEALSIPGRHYRDTSQCPEALKAIHDAVGKHDHIPNFFEEA